MDTDLFAPGARPTLTNGVTRPVCVMAFTGGSQYGPGTAFEIGAQLVDPAGEKVRVGRLHVGKAVTGTDGFRRIVLNVTPSDVPPGDYAFLIRFKDPTSGAVTETRQPVHVN